MTFNVFAGRNLRVRPFLVGRDPAIIYRANRHLRPACVGQAARPGRPFEKRINEQLDLAQKSIDQLLAVKGPRTVENTLVPYDNAVQCLDTAAYQSGVMQIVSPDAAVRDRAQVMVQKVSAMATALALNQALYHAMAALDVSKADPATQYYVQRTLLEFRLAGVDKDDATRARIKALNDDITKFATQFQRNLQESQLKVVVKDPKELDGLPEDYIKAHKPAADGTITLTSDSPDVTPVLKFAKSADLRKRIFLAYNNRAYPQNVTVLADLLKKREELANLLGYKHWSDFNAADKMAVEWAEHRQVHQRDRLSLQAGGRPRIQDAAGVCPETGPIATADPAF